MADSPSYSYKDKAKRPKLKAKQKVVQNSLYVLDDIGLSSSMFWQIDIIFTYYNYKAGT